MTRAAAGGGERGSAALEFAMVLPILLIVTLGLVQAGLFVRDQLVLVEAARAGAHVHYRGLATRPRTAVRARARAHQACADCRPRKGLATCPQRRGVAFSPIRPSPARRSASGSSNRRG